jgi:hypothetical protein
MHRSVPRRNEDLRHPLDPYADSSLRASLTAPYPAFWLARLASWR